MDVVALLSPPLLSHLKVVLAPDHTLHPVAGWRGVSKILRHRKIDAVVVDPEAAGPVGAREIRALREQHPTVPVVIYTRLTPTTLRTIVELAHHGAEHVVLYRFDDEPRRFLDLLGQLPGFALSERLLARLSGPLAAVPPGTARAIERMVRSPHRFATVEDLAEAAGTTERQVYRQLKAAGFASPRWLVQGARLLHAYAYLHGRGYTVKDVARMLGYSESRVLTRQMEDLTGMRPLAVRRQMSPEEFVRTLGRKLQVESE